MVNFAKSPRQRMLDAYRGVGNERPPVAPEFWIYYPARYLGVDLITFEREIPFHLALKEVFSAYQCEGWGAYFLETTNPEAKVAQKVTKIDAETVEERETVTYRGQEFSQTIRFHKANPSWLVEGPVKNLQTELEPWMDYLFNKEHSTLDLSKVSEAYEVVGESYLLEGWLGFPFFDFYALNRHGSFESSIYDFVDPEMEPVLISLRERYTHHIIGLLKYAALNTSIESFVIGCSYSCVSLLGASLWRKWDKPFLKKIVEEAHKLGKLVHIHFHGRSTEVIEDLVEIGADCVCPFERPVGGNVEGREGLVTVMKQLGGKVTFNGNVHTIDTLIRGTPQAVRNEVIEIKEAALQTGTTHRLIIGSGDQVGQETPEENIWAMIEEGKRNG